MKTSRESIEKKIFKAMDLVYAKEYWLIEKQCHEINIVGAFYHYFRNLYGRYLPKTLSIDMEYSRKGHSSLPKIIETKQCHSIRCGKCGKCEHPHRVRSDFVIHHRGDNSNNLLVLEFKGEWTANRTNCDWEVEKLKILTGNKNNMDKEEWFGYSYGGLVIVKPEEISITWFENGRETETTSQIMNRIFQSL